MKYTITLTVEVEADCSRAALARVLAHTDRELGEFDAEVDPDDGDIGDGEIFAAPERVS